jgi:hypothetical protein
MSSVLDLQTIISKGKIFLLWVVYICGTVTLGEKGNILEPGISAVFLLQCPVCFTYDFLTQNQ